MSYFFNKTPSSYPVIKTNGLFKLREFILSPNKFSNFLFSSLSPIYEEQLMEEVFVLKTYVGLSLDEINQLRIMDRKYFIMKYNEKVERENRAMKGEPEMNSTMDEVKELAMKAQEKREA